MTLLSDDRMEPAVMHDPHSYYRGLRDVDPVRWNATWGGWVLTRQEDVVRVLGRVSSTMRQPRPASQTLWAI